MKKLWIHSASSASQIVVGESITRLNHYLDGCRTVIITDSTVARLYRHLFPDGPVISIGLGEPIKTLETVTAIFNRLVDLEVDRSTFILGVGGGIVCDITGFAASTFMRGTRFGFIPTTLLAQVDASVGGKNGVNFRGYKNMVGLINQPELVICDLTLLQTLPNRQIRCGFAEIIKHGVIADGAVLDLLETGRDHALGLDAAIVAKLVYRSIEIKAAVVARDEREQGQRRQLNFGHTFAHAIETLTGIAHGEAVGIGMVLAARLSVAKGLLAGAQADRLERIIASYGLPVRPPVELSALLAAMRKDKKRQGELLHFVFADALGSARVEAVGFDVLHELAQAAGLA